LTALQGGKNRLFSYQVHKIMDRHQTIFIYSVLAFATLAIFWQVHSFEFTNYDDDKYVSENSHISTGLKWDNIVWVFTNEHNGNWHPLTGLSHILDCELFGLKPGWHHIINLFFHTINVLLLFTVLKQMTGTTWQSAFTAALFALHPLHVESVAWIAERKDVLSTFFWVLTMAVYFRYAKNPSVVSYIFTLVLFVLGLMSKPMVVTLPFALLLIDYWPLNRLDVKNKRQLYRLILEKIPFFIFSAASSIITFLVQKSAGAVGRTEVFPLTSRVANAVVSYMTYIMKMLWPMRLAVFYPHPENKLPYWQVFSAGILLAAITICVICFAAKYKYLATGWFWYLGTLVPVIGLVQAGIQAMADRYTYIPLIGLFIIVAWGATDLLRNWKHRFIVLGISSTIIISILSFRTMVQTSYWHDSRVLFEHALKVTKRNYLAYNKVAYCLMEEGKYDEAINRIQSALQLKPHYAEALNNLGFSYTKLDRWPEAIEAYKLAIKIKPSFANAQYNLGFAYLHLGRTDEAIDAFKQAINCMPDYAEAYFYLGLIHLRLDSAADAVKDFEQAVKIKPDFAQVYYYLGTAYKKLSRTNDEMQAYFQAIKIKPDYAEAYNNLGILFTQVGRFQEAVTAFTNVARLKPDDADVYNNLGTAYGRLDRFAEAVQALQQAVRIKPDLVSAHYNLGVAYGNLGRYQEAIKAYQQVIRLKPDDVETYCELGNIYGKLGQLRDAIEAYKQAIRIKPDYAKAYLGLGLAYSFAGDTQAAMEQHKILKTLNPELADQLSEVIYK
jgi:tetratricopeptide (TPR) repeat protein